MIRHKNRKSKYKRRNQRSRKTKKSMKNTKKSVLQYGGEHMSGLDLGILQREKEKKIMNARQTLLNSIKVEALKRQEQQQQQQYIQQNPQQFQPQIPQQFQPKFPTIEKIKINEAKFQKF